MSHVKIVNIHPAKNITKNRRGPATPFWVDKHAWQNFQTYFVPTNCKNNYGKIYIRFLVIIF